MIQERVDSLYQVFVSHVAEMRGLSEEAVRATEAKVFLAKEAVELGLADKIMSADEFMAYLEDDGDSMDFSLRSKQKNTQEQTVTKNTVDMEAFETMQAQLAELKGLEEKMALFETEKAEMTSKLEAAQALVEQKEAEEKAAKLEAFKTSAAEYAAFGLDAEKFADYAMSADAGFVEMVSSALADAKTKVEASAEFEEIGLEVEGEAVEAEKESATMVALKSQFKTKEAK